jgi:hypothetical protein
MNVNIKKYPGRRNKINRFNGDPNKSKYFEDFQNIIIECINLQRSGKYNQKNINKVIRSLGNRNPNSINTDITKNFLVSCEIEPEIYIKIQNIVKTLTNQYTPMDEFIYLLLTHFIHIYGSFPKIKVSVPYKRVRPGNALKKLKAFHLNFKKYYHNIYFFTEV